MFQSCTYVHHLLFIVDPIANILPPIISNEMVWLFLYCLSIFYKQKAVKSFNKRGYFWVPFYKYIVKFHYFCLSIRINAIYISIYYSFNHDTSCFALNFVLMSHPFISTLSLLFQYGDEQLIHNDLVLFQYNHDKCFSYSRWAFIQKGSRG